tara:strand:+ start:385 stop:672 length:288 start_codon:yes stop_codon:yes gene_type:complete
MKWAIVFYALISLNGEMKEHISWGITFNHHEKCINFYEQNKTQILEGLRGYATNNVDPSAVLLELGCAHATADFTDATSDPIVTLKMPLYQGENI